METHFFVPRWTLQGVLLLPSWTLRDPSSTRFGPILDPTSTPTRPGEGPRQSLAKHSSVYTARPGGMREAIKYGAPPPRGRKPCETSCLYASTCLSECLIRSDRARAFRWAATGKGPLFVHFTQEYACSAPWSPPWGRARFGRDPPVSVVGVLISFGVKVETSPRTSQI